MDELSIFEKRPAKIKSRPQTINFAGKRNIGIL